MYIIIADTISLGRSIPIPGLYDDALGKVTRDGLGLGGLEGLGFRGLGFGVWGLGIRGLGVRG